MRSLQTWLERHSKTQKELADAIGVTPGAISQYIAGTTRPSLKALQALAEVTGIPVAKLLTEANTKAA